MKTIPKIVLAAAVLTAAATFCNNVKKISDDLYVGKVADDFYLAMERIDKSNIKMWRGYISDQIAQAQHGQSLKYLPNLDGASHFELVLNNYDPSKKTPDQELWVAYASTTPVTQKAKLKVSYSGRPSYNPNIEMYVTVITSPNALLTSHMGISRTLEAALDLEQVPPARTRHPQQSIHLHSFAAKVIKQLDPKKVYMLTAPATVMRSILINKMPPNSVFVGDSLYKEKLEAAQMDPTTLLSEWNLEFYDKMVEKEGRKETAAERKENLKELAEERYESEGINEKLSLLQTHPPRILRKKDEKSQTFTILTHDEKPLVTFDQSSSIYPWMFTKAYRDSGLHLPYVLIDLDALAKAKPLSNEK